MNTKVWYLPYFEGVYHTRMIETFSNASARMVHTMVEGNCKLWQPFFLLLEVEADKAM